MNETIIRALVDMRDRTLQKSRIAFGNRISAIERGDDIADEITLAMLSRWHKRFDDLEAEATNDLIELVKDETIIKHMVEVKGVAETLAAKVISMIDIERADTVSALWRYAGYGVVNGEREKPVKGEKLHYNKRLKTTCYQVGTSFLRSNSPYRQTYDNAREHYEVKRAEWTKGHQHNAAMRKMIKLWLSHLWVRWRELEGLPTNHPYVHEKLGHNHYIKPEDMGWPQP